MKRKIIFSADFILPKDYQKYVLNTIFKLRKNYILKNIIKEPFGYFTDKPFTDKPISKLLFSCLGFPHLIGQALIIQWKTKDMASFCIIFPNKILLQVQINNCVVVIGY